MTLLRPALAALVGLTAAAASLAGPNPPAEAAGSTYTWVGSSTGDPAADTHDFQNPHDWSPLGVPTSGDSIVVMPPGGQCFAHVDDVPTGLSLVDVTLADTGDTSTASLCEASLDGGDITVTGQLSWSAGRIATPLTVAVGASAVVTGGHGTDTVVDGALTVEGTLTVQQTAVGAALRVSPGDALTIASGASMVSHGANYVTSSSCCVHPATLVNHGTLAVPAATLELESVELDQDATVAFSHGGRLLTTAAPVTTTSGATYQGSGTWQIAEMADDDVVLSGTQTLGSGVTLALRTLDPSGNTALGGTAILTGSGTFLWANGTVSAALTTGPRLRTVLDGAPDGNDKRVLASRLVNHGTLTLGPASLLTTADAATLVNASDGRLLVGAGARLDSQSCCVHPDSVLNQGTAVVAGGARGSVLDGVYYRQTSGSTTLAATARLKASSVSLTGGRVVVHTNGRHVSALASTGDLRLRTALQVVGDTTPAATWRPVPVTASGDLVVDLGCLSTTGAGTTGTRARHWSPVASAHRLTLVSRPGRHTHC